MNTHCKVGTACREDDFVCLQEFSFSSKCAVDKSAILEKCIKDRDECTLMVVPSKTELLIVIHFDGCLRLSERPFGSCRWWWALLELSEKCAQFDYVPLLFFKGLEGWTKYEETEFLLKCWAISYDFTLDESETGMSGECLMSIFKFVFFFSSLHCCLAMSNSSRERRRII